jgi:hypothetical protein
MKAIIEGFRFDTEKAIKIGDYDNGLGVRDFSNWNAGLYVTKRSKNYFLAGAGGAMTRFSRTISQNEWCGGSKIIPMDKEEAFEWSQRYLSDSIVEEYFPDMIQDA